MESNIVDDDVQESENDYDEEDEDAPVTPRRRRVSGLVRLTGRPKTPTPKKSRTTKTRKSGKEVPNTLSVDATDDDATPKPASKRKPRGRPKKNARAVDSTSAASAPGILRRTKTAGGQPLLMVPDSAGEEKDVWIISSDDE